MLSPFVAPKKVAVARLSGLGRRANAIRPVEFSPLDRGGEASDELRSSQNAERGRQTGRQIISLFRQKFRQ